MLSLAFTNEHMNYVIKVRETRMLSLNDSAAFLSKSVKIFGYFGKVFDYGLQFSFSRGSIRN